MNEIAFDLSKYPGLTTLYVLMRNLVQKVVKVSDGSIVTYNPVNRHDYAIVLSEFSTGFYTADIPAGVIDGRYSLVAYDSLAGAGSETDGDPAVGYQDIFDKNYVTASNVVQINDSANAAQVLGRAYAGFETGTAQAGSTIDTIVLRSGASSVNNQFVDQVVCIVAGTGVGQTNRIIGYSGTTKVATVRSDWVTVPDNTSQYIVLGRVG